MEDHIQQMIPVNNESLRMNSRCDIIALVLLQHPDTGKKQLAYIVHDFGSGQPVILNPKEEIACDNKRRLFGNVEAQAG